MEKISNQLGRPNGVQKSYFKIQQIAKNEQLSY